jgi:D-methionine transport system substrate-binding protein
MKKMKQLKILSLVASLGLLLACKPKLHADLTVGTISGPETELVKLASEQAKQQYGMTVKIIEFTDYHLPNEALVDGSLDMNIYQHLPFLKASIAAKKYPIEAVGKTFIYPMGIYSNRYKSIDSLPQKASIAIPNDPSNSTRALILLQQAGLIECKNKEQLTVHDIVSNPKQLKIKELDAAQLPRVLMDVDAAVINTSFAIPAGLTPGKDSIYIESKDSPYANLIVVKKNNDKQKYITQFIQALHAQAVITKADELFGSGGAIPAW